MRFISFVKRNIRRTPYQALAAIMVMFFTFLTMLVFLILAIGSQVILKEFESKPQVIGFFENGTSEQDIKAISQALMATGKVSDIKYKSKEDALKHYKELNKDDPKMLELVTASILPASLEISTTDPNDLAAVAAMLAQEPVIGDKNVVFPKDLIKIVTDYTQALRWTGSIIVGFMFIFSLLIIIMIIGFKIRVKRTEIETMKLLGASIWFIRTPFILEGIFYSCIGAFFAWITTNLILWYITPFVSNILAEVKLLPVNPLIMIGLLVVSQLVAVIIGFVGSFGAIRRYLHL